MSALIKLHVASSLSNDNEYTHIVETMWQLSLRRAA